MAKTALLSSRAVVKVGGADARAFLKGLLTADAPEPGKARFGALLTPQGQILFDMVMAAREGEVFLDCRAEAAEALVKRL
ncbi:MAG: folate-binding protein, partial [Amphiplicatus sp.]